VELREDLDTRGLAAFTRRLEADALDPSVDGVLVVLRGSIGGLAAADEIGDRIASLRRRGRKVVCHLEEGTGSHLAACAGADRIWIGPAGGIRLVGVRDETLFFRDLLSKIGVRAQIVRVGDYKSAPESVTRMSSSDPAIEERDAMLDDEYDDLVARISRGRRLSPERVRALIDEGPYTAPAAIRAGLADDLVNEDDLERPLAKLFGHRVLVAPQDDDPEAPRRWARAPTVAIVYVEDDIVDGDSFDVPLLGSHFTGAETIVKALDDLRGDSRVGAVVLRIDSPGGSATASERIWRAVWRTRKVKPVVASMGSMAASGGYYAAAAADTIFAEPSTLTGSIGIFYGKADVEALFREIGIGVELAGRGRRAHMESTFRPYTDDELAFLEEHIHDFYGIFVRRVATGRHKRFDEIDRVGQGRVWSGRRAKEHGLVDRIGGLSEAIREAKRRAGLPWDAAVLERPERGGGLVNLLLGSLVEAREDPPMPAAIGRMARALGPFAYLDPATPQARLPFVRLAEEP
jgi:protease-4